ncbi:hypothetical protein Gohar_003096, partial [Gossypium harknessii]|nr:hypothetical protein [Gossypium harknessii]
MSYLLQDEEGQILGPHSIGVGLEYPEVGPKVRFLKEIGRAEFHTTTTLEASHALAFLEKLCPTLPNGTKVVVNLSSRRDKDATI